MQVEAIAGTPNWLAARRGCLTASRMNDAADFLKTGKPGAKRIALLKDLAAEAVSDYAVDHFVTNDMQWGIDNQSNAIAAYEARKGLIVGPEVFVLHDEIDRFGATPDGLIGHDGLLEVKCPRTTTFISWVTEGVVPEQHKLQMLAQLACSNRDWVEFVAYDPRMPEGKQMFVRRFEPADSEIERVEQIAADFVEELTKLIQLINEAEYA